MEGGPEFSETYGRWAKMQGNLQKVGPNPEELMEGEPESRETYGSWAQIQGEFETKHAKNGMFKVGFYIFFHFLLNIFKNNFRIKIKRCPQIRW